MGLDKETKQELRRELKSIAHKMVIELDFDEFRKLKERHDVISSMLKTDWKISPDTVLIVGGNLLGIILILKHEQLDIITSKAIGFVLRGRV